jgi:hypothetical protein
MPRLQMLAIILLTIWTPLPGAAAQKQATNMVSREQERRSFAINLARAINAAEANYKKTHDSYATWDTLLGTGDFSESGTKWASESFPTVAHALYGRGPEIVPGWKLRLIVSSAANSYDLLLEDVTDPKCGYAVVSDERGLIRQAKVIDCGGM